MHRWVAPVAPFGRCDAQDAFDPFDIIAELCSAVFHGREGILCRHRTQSCELGEKTQRLPSIASP